jgi:glycosyltransferase involved in cell wall biosynthesis
MARVTVPPAPAEPRTDALEAARALTPTMRRDFCVVIPAYNEVEMVPELLRALQEGFRRYELDGEVVLVDDGSSDGTGLQAAEMAEDWPNFTVLRHRTNLGKTEAMLTGAAHTERSWIVLFDADLQHLPDEIPRFLADLNSMKAFRKEILQGLHLRHDWHRFFVVLAHARGWSVTEIDIPLYPRRAGESKFTGPWRVVVGFLDLLSVGFLLRFSRKPLLFFGSAGALLLVTGTVVGLVALYVRFVMGVGFRPVLYLVILLVTLGALLVGVGFLAELVAQLREEVSALHRREGAVVLEAGDRNGRPTE